MTESDSIILLLPKRAYGAMQVFSISSQKYQFYHICVNSAALRTGRPVENIFCCACL